MSDGPAAPLPPARMKKVRAELLRWFDRCKRDLPWRRTTDPYAIWLSEIMLQQTQVSTVIPYYQRFLRSFPDIHRLAQAPLEQVLALWQGLGYYHRARALHRAAQALHRDHGGKLPQTVDALLELPGFGRYTAGAVASIAFGVRAPLVDGNVARVLSRLFLVEGVPGERARDQQLWELAEALVPDERPGDFNQALMELGAMVCRTEAPTCLVCPLRAECGAVRAGRVTELPAPKPRRQRPLVVLAVAVWQRRASLLLARRQAKGLFGGLWELPCVELQPKQAAMGALQTAVGQAWELGASLGTVRRTLTHRELELRLFPVRAGRVPKRTEVYEEFRWVTEQELPSLGISTAMHQALRVVLPRLAPRAVAG